MLGYMTAKEAVGHGFTHHGSYYGIPCWLSPGDPEFPVATKWAPMEYLMPVVHTFEGAVMATVFPDDEPSFMFKVGAPING